MTRTSTSRLFSGFSLRVLGVMAGILTFVAAPIHGQVLYDSYADGNFSASPVWGGNTTLWQIVANSDAAAGATGSNTLRLNGPATAQTDYLSSQISTWGTTQEWGFWLGRRAQAYTAANQAYIWLYANESTLNNATVDGYRLAIGDDTGGDDIRLEYIVNGAVSATVITSSGSLTNGLTDIGFLIRVTRSSVGAWQIFTSTLPTSNGTGAIATDVPNATNASVNQGTGTNNTLVPASNGYIGVAALHSTGASAIVAVEFDQAYFSTNAHHFRSKTTGNWSAAATWESSSDGTNWFDAVFAPDNNANTITIRNTHVVTVATSVTTDQTTIDAGGQVVVSTGQTLTVADGTGNDLTVNGTLTVDSGGALATSGALANNSTSTINGTLQINTNGFVSTNAPTYGSSSTLVYNSGGSYGVSTEWTGNSTTAGLGVPQNVTVQNSTTVNMPNSNRGMAGNLNISSGTLALNVTSGDLYLAGNMTRASGATFTPNERAVFFNGTGSQVVTVTGGGTMTFNYLLIQSSSTLQLATGTNVTVDRGSGLTLGSSATNGLDLNGQTLLYSGGGNLNLSSGARGVTSSVAGGVFSTATFANITVTSGGASALTFGQNVILSLNSMSMNFNGVTTINGTLRLNNGGAAASSPTYGSNSTLLYNAGGAYGQSNEWIDNVTSGAGYPANVQVSNSTTLNLAANSNINCAMSGNLTIDAGSTVAMNGTVGALTVGGNVNLNGTLALATVAGGDIVVGGDWTEGSSSTFTANSRAVFLNGTGTQTISRSSGTNSFPYLLLNKTGGSVALSNDVTVSAVLTFQAANTAHISTGTNSLIVSDNAIAAIVRTGSGHVIGNLNRRCGVAGNYFFPVGTSEGYTPVNLNYASIDQQQNVVVNSNDTDHPDFATYGLSATKYVSRHWNITRIGAGNFQVDATFTYLPADLTGGAMEANIKAAKYDAPNWTLPTTTTGTNSFTATGLTSFSSFMGGETPPDYTITTTGNAIVITDDAGNSDVLDVTESGSDINFDVIGRTYSLDGGATTAFPVSVSLTAVTSITMNAEEGDDQILIDEFSLNDMPNLTINGGTGDDEVRFNGGLTFVPNANLDVDLQNDHATPGTDRVEVALTAILQLSGTGTATIKASKDVLVNTGTGIETEDGNLTIEANQQGTPTSGNFVGVDVNGGQIQSIGTGIVSVKGKGGNAGSGSQHGVRLRNAGQITGGTTGTTTVQGIGGASSDDENHGVLITDSGSSIGSNGSDVSITGNGGGQSGTGSDRNNGVRVGPDALVSAGGSGTVTVQGTGGTALGDRHYGVAVDAGSITSFGGDVSVTGTGGTGISGFEYGVWVASAGSISSGGTGTLTVLGTGGTGTGGSGIGVVVTGTGSSIYSSGGDVIITGNGNGSGAIGGNSGVQVELGGAIISNGTGTATVVGNGKISSGNANYGVHVTGANSLISSDGGDVSVTGTGGGTGLSANNHGVFAFSGGTITSGGTGILTVQGTGGTTGGDSNYGVYVHGNGSNAMISSAGGPVQVTGQGNGTGAQSHGVRLYQGGVISAGGSGTVTVQGTPSGIGSCYGVWVSEINSAITSGGGNITVTGLEGSVLLGAGISVETSGAITTAANGGTIALIANSMALSSTVNANSTNSVTLRPYTNGAQINLGSATDPIGGPLSLTDTELDLVTGGTIIIGSANSGTITVSAAIDRAASTNMELHSAGDVLLSGGGINTGGGTLLLDPGTSPAAVKPTFTGTDATASTLSFASDLAISINGTTPGDGTGSTYTQLTVAGMINLTGVDLILSGSHTPVIGQTFTIVDNDGADAVVGTFTGLTEGAYISSFLGSGLTAQISYLGGTGNDVVLTVVQADYSITTTGNNIVITDLSGNGETLAASESGSNIRFVVTPTTRTYSINGGAITAFTTPADVALAGANSITINTAAGADIINIGAFTANLPSLTVNGGTGDDAVNFNGDITFATNANLDVDLQNDDPTPGTDALTLSASTNLLLSGTGAATVKVSKNVTLNNGSSLETVNGNLTVEANQQGTPTSGTFSGVTVSGGGVSIIQSTGTGAVTVKGKGGDSGLNNHGILVGGLAKISGGTSGTTLTVIGNGGASTSGFGYGVYATGVITSSGGNVSVTGTGGGAGAAGTSYGVNLDAGGQILAGGTGTVTVVGTGAGSTGINNIGIHIFGSGSKITSSGGNVHVTGNGGGAASGLNKYGVYVETGGQILAGGTGTVTVVGNGGTASANASNYGVYVTGTSTMITSSGGNVSVTGTGGGAGSSNTNYGVFVQSGGQITAGSTGTVAVIGNGGTTASGNSNSGVHVTGLNARITSAGGNVSVGGTGGGSGLSINNNGVLVSSAGEISAGGSGTVTVIGQGSAATTGTTNYGVHVTASATITSAAGNVSVTGTGGGTGSGTNYGVFLSSGGMITAGASGTVTVVGQGSAATGNNNWGVHTSGTSTKITSSGGNVSVTGTGGGSGTSASNYGVHVLTDSEISAGGSGTVTVIGQGGTVTGGSTNYGVYVSGAITSAGGNVSVTGTGGGSGTSSSNHGIRIEIAGQITAGGTGTVAVVGQGGTAPSGNNNYGVQVFGTGSTITSVNGNVQVTGTGGGSGSSASNNGVSVTNSAIISAGGTGSVTVEGNGRTGVTGADNLGVSVTSTAKITSSGGNVSVTGTGGGSGASGNNIGVQVQFSSAEISAGGTGTVTVMGNGGTGGNGNTNYGVFVGTTNAIITSSGGDVSVTGTGGGTGSSGVNNGVIVFSVAQITAGGTGNVTVVGTGGTSAGMNNNGVFVAVADTKITSSGGNVSVTGVEGGGSNGTGIANLSSAAITTATNGGTITLIANSMNVASAVSANGTNSVTLRPYTNGVQINLGSATDPIGGPLSLTDAELDLVTGANPLVIGNANSGAITTSAAITRAAATNMELHSAGDVLLSGGGINTGGGTLLLDPGTSPAAVKPTFTGTDATASTLSFASDLAIAINGTTPGDGTGMTYTRLTVAGMVNLTGVDLILSGSHTPVASQTFTIVDNDGGDAIIGTFTGLAEGTTIPAFLGSSLSATITYIGGDGNDVVLTVVQTCPATSTIWYVNAAAGLGGNGASWTCAFQNVQDAINSAASGHQIWVAAATYKPTKDPFGNASPADPRDKTFYLKDGVKLYGGFVGTETMLSQRDWNANVTILSGDIDAGGPLDAYHVVVSVNDAAATELNGFTVTGGSIPALSGSIMVEGQTINRNTGAGMYNHTSSPTITNCIFTGNFCEVEGGGLYNNTSASNITNCTFSGNGSGNGGGMYNTASTSSLIISNCTFLGNNCSNYGGGMANFSAASPTMTNCTFNSNTGGFGGGMANISGSAPMVERCSFKGNTGNIGGGMFNDLFSSPTIVNGLFSGNASGSGAGGGIRNYRNSSPSITNCSFSGNNSPSNGGGMYNLSSCFPVVKNCIFWGNSTEIQDDGGSTANITYSIVQGGFTGMGNLDADPLFVSQPAFSSAPTTSGDLHLQTCSPAIDAGTASGAPATDLEISPRPVNQGYDMGVYEFQTLLAEANLQGNSTTIADGDITPTSTDHTDFGGITVGGNIVRTFTIQNTGGVDLSVSSISSDNGLFTIGALTPASPIPAGMSATFTVTFSPTASGIQNATITISNNDCNEAVYDFAVTGTGICPVITFTATPANECAGFSDGSIAITGETGGTGPYMYSKDNGSNYQASATFTGLAANNYMVKIKDANGCESAAQNIMVGSTPTTTYYRDIDGDGLGDPNDFVVACTPPVGYVTNNTDACPLTVSSVSNSGNCGCSPGFYPLYTVMSGENVITGCQICPAGSYCPDGLVAPIPCPAGQYSGTVGATSCTPCSMGYFNNTTGATSCDPCPMGKFNNMTGQSSCQDCPMGTFNNMTGQSSCQDCPMGTFNAQTGAISCDPCPMGTFNNLTGQSSCQPCPAGTYNDQTGQTECTACPSGTYNNNTGQTACTNCPTITFTATPTAAGCSGGSDGQIAISGESGGAFPYSYSKDNGLNYQPVFAFYGLAAGTYLVKIKDANGCESAAQNVVVSAGEREIAISCNATNIADGDNTPSNTDCTAFGCAQLSGGMVEFTYTITNSGPCDLTLNGSPLVLIGGLNAGDFAVTQDPSSTVAANGGTTTFKIKFDPTSTGTRVATVIIANDDSDENPFTFEISGLGTDVVATCPSNAVICAGDLPYTLSGGSPMGGVFSGTHVTGNQFNPPPPMVQSFFDVFYTVTDPGTGCENTCSFQITVNPAPATFNIGTSICSNYTGLVAYLPTYVTNGVPTDFTWTFTDNPNVTGEANGSGDLFYANLLNTSNVMQTVSYTITPTAEGTGCVGPTFTYQVNVWPLPSITCPSPVSINTAAGLCTANQSLTHPALVTNNFNCPATLSVAFSNGMPAPPSLPSGGMVTPGGSTSYTFATGQTVVTYTATDSQGNESNCSYTVTVTDNQPPTATCQSATVILDGTGNATLAAASVNNGSTDNCGVQGVSVSPSMFTCANITPPAPVDLIISEYVEGSSNNKYVEIYNPTSASINLANYELRLYANGAGTPTTTNTLSGTLAAGATIVYKNSAATVFLGTSTALSSINFNGDDALALFNTMTNQNVDIFGRIGFDPGTAWSSGSHSTLDKTLRRKSTVTRGITTNPSDFNLPLVAEWDVFNIDVVSGLGSHSVAGGLSVTLTVTDVNSLQSTCTATVYVLDNTAPTLSCPSNQSVNTSSNGTGDCTGGYTILDPVSDNCTATWGYSATGVTTISAVTGVANGGNSPALTFNKGISTVTLTATDASGNIATTCSFTVTVTDNEPPTLNCPGNNFLSPGIGVCTANAIITDPVSDNCTGATWTYSGSGATTISPTTRNDGQNSVSISFNGGITNVTITAMDAASNSAVTTCMYTITVEDDQAPEARCKTGFATLDGNGTATITAADVDNGSTDNCGTPNLSVSPSMFNCNQLTLPISTELFFSEYVEGSSNNKYLEIYNPTAAAVNLANYELRLYANGSSTPTTTNTLSGMLAAGATIVYRNSAATVFTGTSTSLTSIAFNGDDALALFNTATNQFADIFGQIGFDPGTEWTDGAHSTLDKTLRRKSTVSKGITTNPMPFNTLAAEWNVFNQDVVIGLGSHIGPGVLVTLTATDGATSTSTCSASVVVRDITAPTLACPSNQSLNTSSNGTGDCTGGYTIADPVSDNCTPTWGYSASGATTIVAVTGVADGASSSTLAFNKGMSTVTLTATDGSGNAATTCSFTVTVTDNEAPAITCPSAIAVNTASGQCSAVVNYTAPGGTDNCPGQTTVQTDVTGLASGSTFPKGMTTLEYTVTDAANLTSSCSFTVTVTDNQAPTITCAAGSPFARNTDASECNYTVQGTEFNPTAFGDNCPGATISNNFNNTSTLANADLPKGQTTITWTVTDGMNMASTTCQIVVNVTDNQPPSITCPAGSPFARNTDVSECNYTVQGTEFNPTAFGDNCPGATISNDFNNTSTLANADLPKGQTTITWTVTDGMSMASTTCQIVVNVTDNQPPSITCPAGSPFARNTDLNQCNYTVQGTEFNPTFGDNCPGATVSNNFNNMASLAGADLPAGQTTITWTVTDGMGMSSTTCQIVVNVTDNQPPAITCPSDKTIALDNNCEAILPDYTGMATGISDNCSAPGNIGISQSPMTGSTLSGPGPHTVTFTATDEAGRTQECTFQVTGITREIDVRGNGMSIADGDNTPMAADNTNFGGTTPSTPIIRTFYIHNTGGQPLAFSSISSSSPEFTVYGIFTPGSIPPGADVSFNVAFQAVAPGPYTSTITINSNDCDEAVYTFDVLAAVDCVPPAITTCPSAQNVPAANGVCNAAVSYSPVVTGTPTPTWSYQFSGATTGSGSGTGSGSTFNVGMTTVTLTATNACGTTSCSFVVTVNDTQLPGITCPGPATVSCAGDVPGVNLAAVTATDNCGTPTKSHVGDVTTGMTCANRKTVTRTYRATDAASNSATCSQVITVFDGTMPTFTFTPANVTVQCNSVPAVGTPMASDNCGGAVSMAYNGQSTVAGSCTDAYTITRQWTATDACGNTKTATQRINVIDTQLPNFTSSPANITVQCDAIPAAGSATATDNCDASVAITYIGQTSTAGACANAYTLTRRWVAADNCGNTRSISQRIVVVDNGKPTLTIPADATVGSCTAPIPPVGTATATDGCGSATVTYLGQTTVSGTCPASYQIKRTWKATDLCGNTTAATQTIQVSDTGVPVFVTVPGPLTISCTDPIPPLVNPTASDACGGYVHITFLGNVATGSGCSADYTITRTWRADDLCGNTATTTQLITVLGTSYGPQETENRAQDEKPLIAHRSSLIVNPNPTTDRVWIDLSDFADQAVTVSVFGDLGQLVWERALPALREQKLSVSLREVGAAAGVYTLSVRSANGVVATKVVLVE